MSNTTVLRIYEDILEEKLCKKVSSFERKLGAGLGDFFTSLSDELQLYDKEIGAKKGRHVTRKVLLKCLKSLVLRNTRSSTDNDKSNPERCSDSNIESKMESKVEIFLLVNLKRSCWECLLELMGADGIMVSNSLSTEDDSAEGSCVGVARSTDFEKVETKDSDDDVSYIKSLCSILIPPNILYCL